MLSIEFMDTIFDYEVYQSFLNSESKLSSYSPTSIMISLSGGSDSDILLDLLLKLHDQYKSCHFVFFDTGLEYQATKEHILYLENKYGISIERIKPKVPIPLAVKRYGQPFLSKWVSECIDRLQSHNFDWSDDTFDNLLQRYPNCKSALRWWCNKHTPSLCISQNKYLKEFLISNPPNFKISSHCCKCAKKDVSLQYIKDHNIMLSVVGVRKAEGGIRAHIKSCFTASEYYDTFRPIFWYKSNSKSYYESKFNIIHSDCYSVYGLTRTGCCGCPFGRDFENELDIIVRFEPNLFNAVCNIFKDSYSYTRLYRKFVSEHNNRSFFVDSNFMIGQLSF